MRQSTRRPTFTQATALVSQISTSLKRRYGLCIGEEAPRQGQLNFNWMATGPRGAKYVVTIPRGNDRILASLHEEYASVGFYGLGGRFRLRSIPDIVKLTRRCREYGIPVPSILTFASTYLVREFVPGTIYEEFLQTDVAPVHVVAAYLQYLMTAHRLGIVLGDRWGPNEIVRSCRTVCFFDFDIELLSLGPEMELAQAIYFTLSNAREPDRVAVVATVACRRRSDISYDWPTVKKLIRGHVANFCPARPVIAAAEKVVSNIA